jgi:signal transduction histidine kinase
VLLAPALLFGLMEAAQIRLGSSVLGRAMPFPVALTRVLPYWILLGVMGPLALTALRRFRAAQHALWPNVAGIAASAIAFALLALAGRLMVAPIGPSLVRRTPMQLLQAYFLLDILTYSALVGTLYAFHFYRRTQARELAASQLRASLSQARLKALQAQLEPHFLFNTLNAISVLAMDGNHGAVVDTVGRLTDLLRMSLCPDRPQEVPLARELELVDGYLGIQKVRFADRLSTAYDIAPDVMGALVPSMVLQPIVENAVIHGIAAQPDPGLITIAARRENDTLCLEVSDTGPGFQQDVTSSEGTGIGLVNTRARLQQLYGSLQRVDLSNATYGGARVRVALPFRATATRERPTV